MAAADYRLHLPGGNSAIAAADRITAQFAGYSVNGRLVAEAFFR